MNPKICRNCGCIGKPSKGLVNIHNIQTRDLSREFEDKIVDCLKCPNCGHSWIPDEETQPKCDCKTDYALTCNGNCEKHQVNFEMLKEIIEYLPQAMEFAMVSDKYIDNLQLFFKLLSTKPTFAQVAFRELSKFNK